MLEFASAFRSYALEANDGEIGAIVDFLFDGRTSAVRWLVVHTGDWLRNRKIWLHPAVIGKADNDRCELSVNQTKAQLQAMFSFGANPLASQTQPLVVFAPESETAIDLVDDDRYLHSVDAITRFHVVGSDGAIGKVEDLLIDEESWSFPYIVVETDTWWSGNHVLISHRAMKEISRAERQIRADLNRQLIKASPSWNALSDVIKIDTKVPVLSPTGIAAEPDVRPMSAAEILSLVYVADRTVTMGQ
jgi:hypothetical protein